MISSQDNEPRASKIFRPLTLALAGTVLIVVLAFVFLPGFLLRRLLNQDFADQESLFSSVRTGKISTSLLLNEIELTDAALTFRLDPGQPLLLPQVRITRLRAFELIKSLLGLGGSAFNILSEGELVVRGLNNFAPENQLLLIKVGTLSLDGLELDTEPADPKRLDHIRFNSLKFADLDVSLAGMVSLQSEGLSLFNLKDSILGGLIIGGLSYRNDFHPPVKSLSLNNASVSGIDLLSLLTSIDHVLIGLKTSGRLELAMGLNGLNKSIGSLDLSSLSLVGAGDELAFLRRALMDDLDDGQAKAGRLWALEELTIDLDALRPFLSEGPLTQAVLDSLDRKTTASFKLDRRISQAGLENLKMELNVKDRLDASVGLSLEIPDASGLPVLAGGLPKSSLGPGELVLTDRSFLPRLSQALSDRLYGGRTVPEVIGPHLPGFFAALTDPDPGASPLNEKILSLELGLFLSDPRDLKLSLDPSPGYPLSLLDQSDRSLTSLMSGGLPGLAKKYKYAMLRELNLTLEVNGRAPVAVYLNRSGYHVPPGPVSLDN